MKKNIEIAFTKNQYKTLLKLVAVTSTLYGPVGDFVDKKYKKTSAEIEAIEHYLCGFCKEFGIEDIVEEFDNKGVLNMESEWYNNILDDIFAYDEYAAFETVANKLAWRDYGLVHTPKEIRDTIIANEGFLDDSFYDLEGKYYDEFNKNEYERLFIKE